MKCSELSEVNELDQFECLIEIKFREWDTIHENGSRDMTFVTDGFRLNVLRGDICQLRAKRDKLFPQKNVPGQIAFDGTEILAEREVPPTVPNSFMNEATVRNRNAMFANLFN